MTPDGGGILLIWFILISLFAYVVFWFMDKYRTNKMSGALSIEGVNRSFSFPHSLQRRSARDSSPSPRDAFAASRETP